MRAFPEKITSVDVDAYSSFSLIFREIPRPEYIAKVLNVCKERMDTLKDLASASWYFFIDPDYSSEALTQFRESHASEIGIDWTNRS